MHTCIFTSEDLMRIVSDVGIDRLMRDVIAGLERSFLRHDEATFHAPVRDGFSYSEPVRGLIEWMPVIEHGREATIKIVAYHPDNPRTNGIPTILSTAFNVSAETGHVTAIMGAAFPTALRTAGASVIASRVLAKPGASVLGLVGCGAQALAHLHALSLTFPIDTVLVHDVDPSALASFPARAASLGLGAIAVENAAPADILAHADILCTATTVAAFEGPVIEDRNSLPHLHINAVGSDFRGKFELPATLVARALVCPDFREQAIVEGECQFIDPAAIGPDIVRLVIEADAWKSCRGQLTVFDSTGWALEDHAVIGVFSEHARRLGLGTWVEFESVPINPRNPYGPYVNAAHPVAGRLEIAN